METWNTSPRFERGLAIFHGGGVRQLRPDLWRVDSQSHGGHYLVDIAADVPACSCPDFEERGTDPVFRCKHSVTALLAAQRLQPPIAVTPNPKRPSYKQDWPSYEASQHHEREHFDQLLRGLCSGIANPLHTRGRPRKALADVVFACVSRVYSGLSSRRHATEVSRAADAGLIDEDMSSKTVRRYLADPDLSDLLRVLVRESAAPLSVLESQVAIDSSGFSTCNYQRWFDVKHGREMKKAKYVKCHIAIGTRTHVITDVIVTDERGADSPQLPALVAGTAERFDMTDVSADKAYLSHRNFDAIETVGATPYVPFKVGTTGEGPALWRRMYAMAMLNAEEWRRHYHRRSNVETSFSMIKSKFGASVRGKKFTAQRNEVLAKCLAHNICRLIAAHYEHGIPLGFGEQHEVRHVH